MNPYIEKDLYLRTVMVIHLAIYFISILNIAYLCANRYGNVYTATGEDLGDYAPENCTPIIFICTLESFSGLIYAGMGAAILFGKVNRVQSHAHLTFSNTICLQYAEVDLDFVDEDSDDSDCKSDTGIATVEESGDEEPKNVGYRPTVGRGVKFKMVNDARMFPLCILPSLSACLVSTSSIYRMLIPAPEIF